MRTLFTQGILATVVVSPMTPNDCLHTNLPCSGTLQEKIRTEGVFQKSLSAITDLLIQDLFQDSWIHFELMEVGAV